RRQLWTVRHARRISVVDGATPAHEADLRRIDDPLPIKLLNQALEAFHLVLSFFGLIEMPSTPVHLDHHHTCTRAFLSNEARGSPGSEEPVTRVSVSLNQQRVALSGRKAGRPYQVPVVLPPGLILPGNELHVPPLYVLQLRIWIP